MLHLILKGLIIELNGILTGRSARIAGTNLSDILHQAVAVFGFDWVIYANSSYCRVSVIPDGKGCAV